MKKIFFLASLATLTLASCSDDLGNDFTTPSLGDDEVIVVATYPIGNGIESRTTLVNNTPAWEAGDAIGVSGFDTETGTLGTTNAIFSYLQGTQFRGSAKILKNDSIWAYYPYNPEFTVDDTNFSVNINQTQKYNFLQEGEVTYITPTGLQITGCFGQAEAPALAWGNVNRSENQIYLDFNALGAYLVVPVTGYGTVNSISLSVKGAENTPAQLAGTITYDMTNGVTGLGDKNTTDFSAIGVTEDTNQTIDIDCGVGVTLNPTTPVYFWFVVPANTPLNNASYTININDGDGGFTREFKGSYSAQIGRNVVQRLLTNDMQVYNYTGGKYIIQNAKQFIEYAYVATYGAENLIAAYGKMNATQRALFSDLPNMLNYSGDSINASGATIDGLYPALIVAEKLEVSPEAIKTALGDAVNNPAYDMIEYVSTVYASYVNDGSIAPIGGTYDFVIDGLTFNESNDSIIATVDGLVVKPTTTSFEGTPAAGLFEGTVKGNKTLNVSNLILTNTTVDQSDIVVSTGKPLYGFYFLNYSATTKAYGYYNNLTVGEGCNVKTSEGATSADLKALFRYGNAQDVTSYVFGTINYNESGLAFVNQLNCTNSATPFDFTGAWSIDDFSAISVQSNGFLFIVDGENNTGETNASDLIEKATPNPEDISYSVIDNQTPATSYWTGTYNPVFDWANGSTANITAEDLAYIVLTMDTYAFTLNYNINLMGIDWMNNAKTTGVLNVNGNGKTISNVVLNGNKVGQNNYCTLFGATANVSNLTINNVTISNVKEGSAKTGNANAMIGILGANGTAKNVTVNGNISVNVDAAAGSYLGGLFWEADDPEAFTGSKVGSATVSTNKIPYGYVAGQLQQVANSTSEWTVTASKLENIEGSPAYGIYAVTIDGQESSTTTTQQILVNLNGFDLSSLENASPGNGTVISEIGNVTLTVGENLNVGDMVYIPTGETYNGKNTYYQLTVTEKTNEKQFVYTTLQVGSPNFTNVD